MEGQIMLTITKEYREMLDVKSGDFIDYILADNTVILRKVKEPGFKISTKGQVTVPSKVISYLNVTTKNEISLRLNENTMEVIILNNEFLKIQKIIGLDYFENDEYYSIHISDKNVYADRWDKVISKSYINGNVSTEELSQMIEQLEGRGEKNIFSLHKVFDQYMFLILYPPYVAEHLITIHKLGPKFTPWDEISTLWKSKSSFSIHNGQLSFYEEKNGSIVTKPFDGDMFELKKIFDRNSENIENRKGYLDSTKYEVSCSFNKLSDGDIVVIYYADGPTRIDYFPAK